MNTRPLYPVGLQNFAEIRQRQAVYVDKTDLVYHLTHDYKFVFLSRPRRFGKTLLISTLQHYFQAHRDLFAGLAMERLETEWTEYPVLRFDLGSPKGGPASDLPRVLSQKMQDYEELYGRNEAEVMPSERLTGIIKRAYRKTGHPVVVLVDEYDAPMLDALHNPEELRAIRGVMRDFYSALKSCDDVLRFVFLTGISMFSQLSIFSELNNLEIISKTGAYASICGITEQELRDNFGTGIAALAEANHCSSEEMILRLKDEYDGYHFCKDSEGLFNPFSLLNAFKQNELGRYWFRSGTPHALVEMLKKYKSQGKFDINTLEDSNPISAEKFESPLEAETGPIPLLYQAGYLTIKGYQPDTNGYILGIPNSEVRVGLMQNLLPLFSSFSNNEALDVLSASNVVSTALRQGDVDKAMLQLKSVLASVPYMKGDKEILADAEKTEAHYHVLFYFFFRMLSNEVNAEVRHAVGATDVVIKTPKYIYIVEIKIDATPDVALAQIEAKGYATPYLTDERKLVKIGVSFSTQSRTIEEWRVVE
jgi:head-tail adaptor